MNEGILSLLGLFVIVNWKADPKVRDFLPITGMVGVLFCCSYFYHCWKWDPKLALNHFKNYIKNQESEWLILYFNLT
jgi:hypothetical protein